MTKEERRKEREKQVQALKALESPLEPLERVEGEELRVNGLESIYEDVNTLRNRFETLHDIEDLSKAPQRVFMALSAYIGDNLFRGSDLLKDKIPRDNGSAFPTTCGRYDLHKVAYCIKIYYDMCNLYNKAFLFDGVSAFLACSENFLKENNKELTTLGCDIYQKREASLSASAMDTKTQNITGILAGLNHWHGWTKESKTIHENHTVIMYPSLGEIQSSPQITDNQSL